MTIKEELYKIYNEYHNVESHEDAGMMIEFTEKNIAVITDKLDEETEEWKKHDHVLGHFAAYVLQDFKKELEK